MLAATLLAALLALALGAGQAAYARPVHHGAHGKKKKKQSNVLVHCASVTIDCKTHPGPAGPTGPAGSPGTAGAPGHGIFDSIRWEGAVISSDGAPTSIGLPSPSFSQAAGQDESLHGLVTIVNPSGECEESATEHHVGHFEGIVTLDGQPAGFIEGGSSGGSSYSPGSATTVPIIWIDGLAELAATVGIVPVSASAQTHTLAIEVGDDCNASGTTHFTVKSVAIDVLSAS